MLIIITMIMTTKMTTNLNSVIDSNKHVSKSHIIYIQQ